MVNINSLERDGLRQAELCPRHTMMKNNNKPRLRFDLVKLRDSKLACTFQEPIGGKFASLIGLRDEDMDINTMITTYNTAVTDTASEILFNIFLEQIMSDALEEHAGKVSIGGRNITNLRFADDIHALAEEEQVLEALVESLDKTGTRYKMEISAEKTKLTINNANGIQREIKVKEQKLDTVTSFKYLGAIVSDSGSKLEILSRIAQATAALTNMKPIWRDNNVSLGSKV